MNSKMELVSGSMFGRWAVKRGEKSVFQLWAALSTVQGGKHREQHGEQHGERRLGDYEPHPRH